MSRSQHRGQWGMSTVEYAAGTVAACGFACLLFQLLPAWRAMLVHVLLWIVGIRFGSGTFGLPL